MSLNDEIKLAINGHEKDGGKLPPPSDHIVDTQDWCELEALRETLREHMIEIHRLRAALAEGAMQRLTDVQQEIEHSEDALEMVEPVAYVTGHYNGRLVVKPVDTAWLLPTGLALYRAPRREWAGLTDGEKEILYTKAAEEDWHDAPLLEAVLALLKEKNS